MYPIGPGFLIFFNGAVAQPQYNYFIDEDDSDDDIAIALTLLIADEF